MENNWIKDFWHGAVLLSLGMGFIAGFCLPLSLGTNPTDTAKSILELLAGIQASVFAIVFSVIILAVQLSAARYSARLADLFRTDFTYKITVSIFATSIGLDIVGLYLLSDGTRLEARILAFSAGLLALTSFWILYHFVGVILNQTTPEGIIRRVEATLTPEKLAKTAEDAANNFRIPGPYLVPSSIVNSAIQNRDAPGARVGLKVIGSRTEDLLEQEEIQDDTPLDEALEELCVSHLPKSGARAMEEDLEETSHEVVDVMADITSAAANNGSGPVVVHGSRGLSDLISEVGYDGQGERVRTSTIEAYRDCLISSVESKQWNATHQSLRLLGWKTAESILDRSANENFDRRYTSMLVNHLPKIQRTIIQNLPEDISEESVSWLHAFDGSDPDIEFPSEKWALRSLYATMAEITSAALRYEIRTDQGLLKWETVAHGWTKSISELSETNLVKLRQLWLGTLLYLHYLSTEVPENVMDRFTGAKHHDESLRFEIDTIDEILFDNIDPRARIDFYPAWNDPTDIGILTGVRISPIDDPEKSFEEWLKERRHILVVREEVSGGFEEVEDSLEESEE